MPTTPTILSIPAATSVVPTDKLWITHGTDVDRDNSATAEQVVAGGLTTAVHTAAVVSIESATSFAPTDTVPSLNGASALKRTTGTKLVAACLPSAISLQTATSALDGTEKIPLTDTGGSGFSATVSQIIGWGADLSEEIPRSGAKSFRWIGATGADSTTDNYDEDGDYPTKKRFSGLTLSPLVPGLAICTIEASMDILNTVVSSTRAVQLRIDDTTNPVMTRFLYRLNRMGVAAAFTRPEFMGTCALVNMATYDSVVLTYRFHASYGTDSVATIDFHAPGTAGALTWAQLLALCPSWQSAQTTISISTTLLSGAG